MPGSDCLRRLELKRIYVRRQSPRCSADLRRPRSAAASLTLRSLSYVCANVRPSALACYGRSRLLHPDLTRAQVIRSTGTINEVCNAVHRSIASKLSYVRRHCARRSLAHSAGARLGPVKRAQPPTGALALRPWPRLDQQTDVELQVHLKHLLADQDVVTLVTK